MLASSLEYQIYFFKSTPEMVLIHSSYPTLSCHKNFWHSRDGSYNQFLPYLLAISSSCLCILQIDAYGNRFHNFTANAILLLFLFIFYLSPTKCQIFLVSHIFAKNCYYYIEFPCASITAFMSMNDILSTIFKNYLILIKNFIYKKMKYTHIFKVTI